MSQPLSDHEIERLLEACRRHDAAVRETPMKIHATQLVTRLLEENRALRDQAGERERMYADEVGG